MSILFLRLNVSRLNVRQIFHPFLSQKEKNTKEGQNSIFGATSLLMARWTAKSCRVAMGITTPKAAGIVWKNKRWACFLT